MPDDNAITITSHPSRHSRDHFFIEGEGLFGDPATAPATAPVDDAPARARAAAAAGGVPVLAAGAAGEEAAGGPAAQGRQGDDRGGHRGEREHPGGLHLPGAVRRPRPHVRRHDGGAGRLDRSRPTLEQGRSPALDLDSLYGAGPADPVSAEFYKDDRHLKTGRTVKVGSGVLKAHPEYDLAREGDDSPGNPRRALIPDFRNDENLAVGQTHLAFIRFHNRVVDGLPDGVPVNQRFRRARREVTLHYQWMLRTDYLTKICDDRVVNDVFTNGRKVFEVGADPMTLPTMPVEFSVAAFRIGHSMIRDRYDWNAAFPERTGLPVLPLRLLRDLGVPRWRPAGAAEQLDRRLAPALPVRQDRPRRPEAAVGAVQPGPADRHLPRPRPGNLPDGLVRREARRLRPDGGQPGLPQPGAGLDAQAGQRPGHGQAAAPEGRPGHHPHQAADPRPGRRRVPGGADRRGEAAVRGRHPAVVLRAARGRAQQGQAHRRRRPDRGRDLPPGDGGVAATRSSATPTGGPRSARVRPTGSR